MGLFVQERSSWDLQLSSVSHKLALPAESETNDQFPKLMLVQWGNPAVDLHVCV